MQEIRRAKANDAETLSEIAFAAKSYWKYPESWLNSWRNLLTITPEFIEQSEVFAVVENQRILGFYAVTLEGEKAQLEHLWITPEKIGGGIGKKLFAHALEKARLSGAKVFEIESEPNAEEFYRKQGAEKFGESVSEIEDTKRVLPLMRIYISSGNN